MGLQEVWPEATLCAALTGKNRNNLTLLVTNPEGTEERNSFFPHWVHAFVSTT